MEYGLMQCNGHNREIRGLSTDAISIALARSAYTAFQSMLAVSCLMSYLLPQAAATENKATRM